jgi:hypothetical protein
MPHGGGDGFFHPAWMVDGNDSPDEEKSSQLLSVQTLIGPMVGHGWGTFDMGRGLRSVGRL